LELTFHLFIILTVNYSFNPHSFSLGSTTLD